MEIKKFFRGTEVCFSPVDERIGEIRLVIKPIPLSELENITVDKMISLLSQIIIDWNLTEDGKPIECSEENKNRIIPYLVVLRVKTEDKPKTLGEKIFEFAGKIENFFLP